MTPEQIKTLSDTIMTEHFKKIIRDKEYQKTGKKDRRREER